MKTNMKNLQLHKEGFKLRENNPCIPSGAIKTVTEHCFITKTFLFTGIHRQAQRCPFTRPHARSAPLSSAEDYLVWKGSAHSSS